MDFPEKRHPVITAIKRLLCKVVGTLFLVPGTVAFMRLLFIPRHDFPLRVIGLALAATGCCALFGFLLLRFMPAKGPPIRIGHGRH